jgi:crotonobetainyl-CoA:carnitine CoA-transferase CaiB-like acyl-CoA transferase
MFKDLKVVELASVLAGPAVGMFFAELGARVIKIENEKTGGDVTRSWKLPTEPADRKNSAYFSSVNWGKEHFFKDLKNEDDIRWVLEQVKDADIVIANFKSGDDVKLGLDYDSLKQLNPKLIYGRITGFGDEDARPAFDVVLQAETGFMSMNGTPESGPLKMPLALIDVLAAHQLKEAVLLALLKREKTGEGSYVNVSLYQSAVASLINQASNFLMANHVPQRMGSLHPNIAPYGETFITADKRFVVLAVGSDAQFKKMCEVLGDPGIAMDHRYLSNAERVKHRSMLHRDLAPLFFRLDREEIMQLLLHAGVPAGAVLNMDEVFLNPLAQSMILASESEEGPALRVSTIAFDPQAVL